MPDPRGNPVIVSTFCDTSFASNLVTRKSQTGILIFIKFAPIKWYSKRQNSIEASTFGLVFVVSHVGCQMTKGLRYMLHMIGISIEGPINVYFDDKAFVSNTTMVESTLKKKPFPIIFHKVHKCYTKGAICIIYVPTEPNLANVCTKVLTVERKK